MATLQRRNCLKKDEKGRKTTQHEHDCENSEDCEFGLPETHHLSEGFKPFSVSNGSDKEKGFSFDRRYPVGRDGQGGEWSGGVIKGMSSSVKEIVRQMEADSLNLSSFRSSSRYDNRVSNSDPHDSDEGNVSGIAELTSEDEEATELKRPVSVGGPESSDILPSEKEALLETIEILKREQEEMKKKQESQVREQDRLRLQQEEHKRQLNALVQKQPSFKARIRSVLLTEHLIGQSPMARTPAIDAVNQEAPAPHRRWDERRCLPIACRESERLYVQIEELYRNWHRLHLFSTTSTQDPVYEEIGEAAAKFTRYQNCRLQESVHAAPQLRRRRRSETNGSFMRSMRRRRQSRSMSGIDWMDSTDDYASIDSVLEGRPLPIPPTPVCREPPEEVLFPWTITDFQKRFNREAQSPGFNTQTDSFYLFHCGYKVRLEAYLNGNGQSVNKAMSIFLRVIPGEYDAYLPWPMGVYLTVTLVNQRDNGHLSSLKSSLSSKKCFRYDRPRGPDDQKWDAWGLIEFIHHDLLGIRFIQNDTIKLRVRVRFEKPVSLASVPLT